MGIREVIYDERDWFYDDMNLEKYYQVLDSDLSILKIWISLFDNNDLLIHPRAGNVFYCDCPFHKAEDLPVCIKEELKAFFCYGCGRGGTIVTLIAEHFNIHLEDALKILYSYITNDIDSLDKDELEVLQKIFNNYNSEKADIYFEQSKRKTDYLNERIDRYIEQNGYSNESVKRITKRLCCSKHYVMDRKNNK